MKRPVIPATIALLGLAALGACATNSTDAPVESDAGSDRVDSGPVQDDAGVADGDAGQFDADAERPLVCGDAGFCETRLPLSAAGLSLSLRRVWEVASNDVWSVSLEGDVLHYDGTSWTTTYRANHPLYALWASPTDVWVGGEGGLLVHRGSDGVFRRIEVGHVENIGEIAGPNKDDLWFTGREGVLDHFDGVTLTSHPIPVEGVRITTLFARAGVGTFAAGYVQGLPPTTMWDPIGHVPYVFELSPAKISIYNDSIQALKGFVPVRATVTDDPDEARRIFLTGYYALQNVLPLEYCTFGASNTAVMDALDYLAIRMSDFAAGLRPSIPVLPLGSGDVWIPYKVGVILRFTDGALERRSLSMGFGFVPRPIFDVHGDATEAWVVGDGYALKGPAR
ncbi:hypothetical protein AKJ09_11069 [Labilithrix luteola]|uniref:Lipoprotein n=1 Tax=Labilithrix luteola TaxID=1391654 RepID=A0A0K1QF54_9BACT|nr:hypothetical protein [Labilithrix luteola]AKV04406.1 hypothetical protein AKJ09_11069 [Labilithrix luteola]